MANRRDISDSERVVSELGINSGVANIKPVYDAMLQCVEEAIGMPASEGARINIAPRLRMTLLYTIAQTLSETNAAKACVMGTGNRAEAEVGYTTKWGDSASDINPIRNLWVDEVIRAGDEMGYYPDIIHKTPSDGLCGKSDEERLGFSYDDVKAVFTRPDVPEDIRNKVIAAQCASVHKRAAIPAYLPPDPPRRSRKRSKENGDEK